MSDDGMTYEQLRAAMTEGRAISKHFEEIKARFFPALRRFKDANDRGDVIGANAKTLRPMIEDMAALVGYLQLMLDENDRLVAFLIGLEEAATITRQELELLMGLRRT